MPSADKESTVSATNEAGAKLEPWKPWDDVFVTVKGRLWRDSQGGLSVGAFPGVVVTFADDSPWTGGGTAEVTVTEVVHDGPE